MSLLGDTIFPGGNCTGAVTAVTVAVLINVILGNGLAPRSAAFEFNMVNVDASVDNVDIDAITTLRVIEVLGESAKSQPWAMADAGETLK